MALVGIGGVWNRAGNSNKPLLQQALIPGNSNKALLQQTLIPGNHNKPLLQATDHRAARRAICHGACRRRGLSIVLSWHVHRAALALRRAIGQIDLSAVYRR